VIDRIGVLSVAVSLLLLVVVLELVRRRKLTEEYSFLWILFSIALLVLSLKRELLTVVAGWLGVDYAPALLVLLLVALVFAASLGFSVIVSRQRQQIERLIEETAILSAELRDLRAERSAAPLDQPGRSVEHGTRRADRYGSPRKRPPSERIN
jgi:hypothetical protein